MYYICTAFSDMKIERSWFQLLLTHTRESRHHLEYHWDVCKTFLLCIHNEIDAAVEVTQLSSETLPLVFPVSYNLNLHLGS